MDDEPTAGEPDDLSPFDVESFLASKLEGVFDDMEDRVGVIVLVPVAAEMDVDAALSEVGIPELEGYSYVPPDRVAAAAERYAADNGMEPREGDWVAFGLMPRFADTDTSEWVKTLGGVAGTIVVEVDFMPLVNPVPEGWRVIADLPFLITGAAVVEAVDSGIVVVQPNSTRLIGFDGSWTSGEATPLRFPEYCCGGVSGLPVGDSLVLVDENGTATWILDGATLTWRQIDPRPAPGYLLGSVLIDGDMFVAHAAPRTGDPVSAVAALDLDTGAWREIEPVPSPISVGGVTSDGDRLIVAGTRQGPNNNVIGGRNPILYQYTSSEGWRQLPDIPIDGQASTVVWVDAAGLFAWNYDLESALLDHAGNWKVLADVPMPPAECYPTSIPILAGAVGLCGGIAWIDGVTGMWTPIRGPFDTHYMVTDNALIGLVQLGRDQTRVIEYPLPPNEK